MMRILIFGATGMIGNTLFRVLNAVHNFDVWGTVRDARCLHFFSEQQRKHLLQAPDILKQDTVVEVMNRVKPDVVINASGIVKQLTCAQNPLLVLPLNAMFPHQLAALCALSRIRLIQFSTDCVFSGKKGQYDEDDLLDAEDLYGKSKAIGEVNDQSHVVTLRTSTIGHELDTHHGLLEWFLSEKTSVRGFSNAVFSGVPTVELARIVRDYVLPNSALNGLYHVASSSINKYDLLQLIAEVYQHPVHITKDASFVIDRSLNNLRFIQATGYTPLPWDAQIEIMHQSRWEGSCP